METINISREYLQAVKGVVGEIGFAGNLYFPTAVVREFSRLAFFIAVFHQRFDNLFLIIYREYAATVSHDLGNAYEKPLARV